MNNVMDQLNERLKDLVWVRPDANPRILLARRGKGDRQIFTFQSSRALWGEVSFTNLRLLEGDREGDPLDDAVIQSICTNRDWSTSTSIDVLEVMALQDLLRTLVPIGITCHRISVQRKNVYLLGYFVLNGERIRVEFDFRLSTVSSTQAALSRMVVEEMLKRVAVVSSGKSLPTTALLDPLAPSVTPSRSTMFASEIGKAGTVDEPAESHELAGVSGCAMAPTLGMGLKAEAQATGLAEAAELDHPTS